MGLYGVIWGYMGLMGFMGFMGFMGIDELKFNLELGVGGRAEGVEVVEP